MTGSPTTINKAQTAIVFIEFQAEWISNNGVLFNRLIQDKKAFRNAVEGAEKILVAARQEGWTIVHAGLDLRFDPTYRLFAGGHGVMGLRAAIPKAGTWTGQGAEFVSPFVPQSDEFVTQGRSGASVLKNSNFDAFLRNNRIDTLVLLGFATHICVESTLREAHDMGLNTWVVTDGCAAFSEFQHEYFLEHILNHFGDGIESDALIQQILTADK